MVEKKKRFSNEWTDGFVWGIVATTIFTGIAGLTLLIVLK